MKIYLCDFVHDYIKTGSYTFPLNIGYVGSYAKKVFGNDVDISLFKYPNDFLKTIKHCKPDVVGFSHYTWSKDINNQISVYTKKLYPTTKIIFGGPNINYSYRGYERFFKTYPQADFYVCYFGSIPFSLIINNILFPDGREIPSVVYKSKKGIIDNSSLSYKFNIKELSSPYLDGTLDKFFDTRLIPIIETSKGCPYSCTFCSQCQASKNKIYFYDLKIIKDELKYIAQKVKNTNILLFADSNFGIGKNDIEIAKYVSKMTKTYNYPNKLSVTWAKNQPKIYEIAKILNNTEIIASLQSLDEKVLSNVKRKNISLSVYKNITNKVNELKGVSGTEIMLALPGETKESHINTLKQLFDWNVSNIVCYNTLILEGSELSMMREEGNFNCTTKFRLIDSSYGLYDNMYSFETEEGIRSTDDMSEEDILFFRPVHWLIQFLWSYKFYKGLLTYLQSRNINPLDYIMQVIDSSKYSLVFPKVTKLFNEFKDEANDEWFDSVDKLKMFYTENFEWLEEGKFGKMNAKYIFKTLMECKEDFEELLILTALDMGENINKVEEIMNYLSQKIIDFRKDNPFEEKNNLYVPSRQQQAIKALMKQYHHENKNVMFRKMSEYMNINDFFYKEKRQYG